MLVIVLIAALWYGIIPIAGAFRSRYRWRRFRNYFNELRLSPLLDYRQYRQLSDCADDPGSVSQEGGIFHFTGGIESITDAHTLWVKGEDLTIPVFLGKTQCWLLPLHDGEEIPQAPEKLRWNRVSTLAEGVKVFIGGRLTMHNNRLTFVETKDKPLEVIFYNCPDSELTSELISAARTRNEYWNSITPVSLVIGALSLVYIAASLLNRPAFRLTAITALAAVFVPVLPVIPPGLLFTLLYRRLTWNARKLRAQWDLARLANPAPLVRQYAVKAYVLETAAWLIMLAGLAVNVVFIMLIISMFMNF